jgi:putative adhesin
VRLVAIPRVTPAIFVAIALAGAGLSGAVLTGVVPMFSSQSAEPSGIEGMDVLETFNGEVDPALTAGTIDFRTFTGPVHIVAWDQPAYEITVYQRQANGQRLSDAAVDVQFDELDNDILGLQLVVSSRGTYDIGMNQGNGPLVAVVASVPSALAWDAVFVCSGATNGFDEALFGPLGMIFGDEEPAAQACTEGTQAVGGDWNLNLQMEDEQQQVDVPFAIEGLNGGELQVNAQFADLSLVDLNFNKADITTQYGSIEGTLDAAEMSVFTQYGDIDLTSKVDILHALTQYGDVAITSLGGDSGEYEAASQYGDVGLAVVPAPDRGYDAEGTTQYGEVLILLSDMEKEAVDDDQTATTAAAPLGLPALFGEEDNHREGATKASAKSVDFAEKAVQVKLSAVTQYGDVLITDGLLEGAEEQ